MAAELAETSAGKGDQSLLARVQALHEVLAERHGFRGDDQNYDDLENANLISVIERRRGLPVALAILYLDAARRCGWPAEGLNFPGHFMIRLAAADGGAWPTPCRRAARCPMRQLLKRGAGASRPSQTRSIVSAGTAHILCV
jgi:regulator of sirC expression with transglutaminase-like and TPR domain